MIQIKNHHNDSNLGTGHCSPQEIALKCFFLGPQAENNIWVLRQTVQIFRRWFEWRKSLYPLDGKAVSLHDQNNENFKKKQHSLGILIQQIMTRFESEIPKFSPRYMAHMFSEISLPALFGHIITLLHNPNNISGESSRVGIEIEKEAIEELCKMIGYKPQLSKGHFTSGGTVANIEALYRAKKRLVLWLNAAIASSPRSMKNDNFFQMVHIGWENFEKAKVLNLKNMPDTLSELNSAQLSLQIKKRFGVNFEGPVIMIPENKHYSWVKGLDLMGIGAHCYWAIALDKNGRMDCTDLDRKIKRAMRENRPILMVVSVAGSTELGSFDPIHKVNLILKGWQKKGIFIWHHVDAAYGGFFCSLSKEKNALISAHLKSALKGIAESTSTTIDPHKLGYVPYASGAFLAKNILDYNVTAHLVPYINFDIKTDLGLYTIEGSRSAAGAVATWLTARSIGLNSEGYGRILERKILAKKALEAALKNSNSHIRILEHSDTNVLCFTFGKPKERLSQTNQRALKIFTFFSTNDQNDFFISKTTLYKKAYFKLINAFTSKWNSQIDCHELVLLRICLLNPFFDSSIPKIKFQDEFVKRLNSLVTAI